MNETKKISLPGLRSEVQITPGAANSNGVPSWVIHDPLQHRYFHVNRQTRDILTLWREGLSVDDLIEITAQQNKIKLSHEDILNLLGFLHDNHLVNATTQTNWRDFSQLETSKRQNITKKILRNYVFFKIPLFHPQTKLKAFLPYVAFCYSRIFVIIIALAGLAGLYLVSRQWDGFISDLHGFISLEGITYFGIALLFVKMFHELGHAFTATRYGVQVPTMGVAFFLLTPLLFTDVSDAWRLSSRKQRLLISAAGVITELIIACLATLLWGFLPEGPTRDITLILASTSWVMSLGVNLNPLIKFDGYYLLSDLIGIDNLQQRSFALGKWKMRELLFSPGLPAPEKLSGNMQNGLILFAWVTWVYRLILFTTIALLVYHFAFKLLGIFLLVLEIWILLVKPVIAEIVTWYKVGSKTSSPIRIMVTLSIFLTAIGFFVVPRSSSIKVPAVFQASDLATVYPGRAAQISALETRHGSYVKKGAPLVILSDPEIDDQINSAQTSLKIIELRLANVLVKQIDNEEMLVLKQSFWTEKSRLNGLLKEKKELVIRAPLSGYVQELNRDLHPGRWIQKSEYVALITSRKAHIVRGYISESNIHRLTAHATGKFIPDDLTRGSFNVSFKNIARSGATIIDILDLASLNGGSVSVEKNSENQLVPINAQYLVELEPSKHRETPSQIVRGVVNLEGTPESMLARTWNQIVKILIRETGF